MYPEPLCEYGLPVPPHVREIEFLALGSQITTLFAESSTRSRIWTQLVASHEEIDPHGLLARYSTLD